MAPKSSLVVVVVVVAICLPLSTLCNSQHQQLQPKPQAQLQRLHGESSAAAEGSSVKSSPIANNELETSATHMGMGSMMPDLGGMMKQKSDFLHSQLERGMEAGGKLQSLVQSGLQGMQSRSHGRMAGMGSMLSGAQDFMMKSGSELQKQLKQSLDGHMGRMASMQDIGQGLGDQARGIAQTLTSGLESTMGVLQGTGQSMMSQLQKNHHKNTKSMMGVFDSLQGSMGGMGKNMQKNLDGVIQHATSTAQQLGDHLQKAISGPLDMLSSLGSGLMKGKGGGGGGGGGRY